MRLSEFLDILTDEANKQDSDPYVQFVDGYATLEFKRFDDQGGNGPPLLVELERQS